MMKYVFDILRKENPQSESYHQRILYETDNENETVAIALMKINHAEQYLDTEGNVVREIQWEAGCLQKKCGACAMLINQIPALACDTFLKKLKNRKIIYLAPLSKFPVIKDLAVDRSIMAENLKTLKVWSGDSAEIKEKNLETAYEASRCLQCGCCLEACPNFYNDGSFTGAAGFAPLSRLLSSYSEEEKKMLRGQYLSSVFEGCGKSLACKKVCPAQIDLDHLLSRSNAIMIWHRR